MLRLVAAACAWMILAVASGGAQAAGDARVALVIGNGAYQYLPRLANPASDAQLMADTLRAAGFELIGGGAQTDLDRAAFEHAIREFGAKLAGGAVGLFYYAGHGLQMQGANYLVPVSANPTNAADADFELIDAAVVLKQMEVAGSKLNLVILDACRNNPFGGRGLRDAGAGLATMRAPRGTLISYATQPGNVAMDGTSGHSPYTEALAEAMRKPGAPVLDVFNEVGLAVDKETGGRQQPWVATSPLEGVFYFKAPAASVSPASPSLDTETVFWQSIAQSSNPADFEEYLRQYPQGRFAGLARNRLLSQSPPPQSPRQAPASTETVVAALPSPPAAATPDILSAKSGAGGGAARPHEETTLQPDSMAELARARVEAERARLQSAHVTAALAGRQAPPKCGGNADEQVIRPVQLLYQAVNSKNIELYAAQWSDDAMYRDVSNGTVRTKADKIAERRAKFAAWEQVKLTMESAAVADRAVDNATIDVVYSMTVKSRGRPAFSQTHVAEKYIVICGREGRWLIRHNVDDNRSR